MLVHSRFIKVISPVVYEIYDECGIIEKAHMKDLKHYWSIDPNLINDGPFSQFEDEEEGPQISFGDSAVTSKAPGPILPPSNRKTPRHQPGTLTSQRAGTSRPEGTVPLERRHTARSPLQAVGGPEPRSPGSHQKRKRGRAPKPAIGSKLQTAPDHGNTRDQPGAGGGSARDQPPGRKRAGPRRRTLGIPIVHLCPPPRSR